MHPKHKEIEAPRSKLPGIFDRKEVCHFRIRSLTPQQAAGNALAFAFQKGDAIRKQKNGGGDEKRLRCQVCRRYSHIVEL